MTIYGTWLTIHDSDIVNVFSMNVFTCIYTGQRITVL